MCPIFEMDNLRTFATDEKKIDPAKQNARVKTIVDEFTLTAEMIVTDEFLMSLIPETALLLDAYIKIPVSLGTQGKLDMGLKAHVDLAGNAVAEDFDSLVFDADAGGQAVLQRSALTSVALLSQIGKGGAQPFLRASELSDVGIGKKIQAVVRYSLP